MTASAGTVRAVSHLTTGAALLGGEPHVRAEVLRLLGDAGFRVAAEPLPHGLIVLLSDRREDARLRQVRTLAAAHPSATVVVVVPADVPNASLRRVLLAGAAGIVLAGDAARTLVPTLRATLAGQLTVPSALGQQIAPRPLSHREKQILSLVVLGMTNREIAAQLFLAESTVKTHLSSAFRKIDARSRSEAVAKIQDPDSGIALGALAVTERAAG